MSVFKRGRIWWYKFYFANNLVRESAKTSSKTLAKLKSSAGASWRKDTTGFPARTGQSEC